MDDVRYAFRFLWAHKSFTLTATLTLALGLGANTALFGLLNTALRPLPLPHADQLVSIAAETKDDNTGGFQYSFSIEALKDLQQRAEPFSTVVGHMPRIGGISVDGRASQFWFTAVSDNYFAGLGVTAAHGTLFSGPSGSPVHVVLGHSFWRKAFGGDPGAIGRSVRINGAPAIISGVVAKSFRGTLMGVELDGYVALDDYGVLMPDARRWLYHNRKARPLELFGRLKPGVSLREAQAAMDVLMATLAAEHPETDQGIGVRLAPEPRARPLPMRALTEAIPLVQFFGQAIAGLVLLLACTNVANLLLVRATARERDMAVRTALGASRARLVRLMVVEGLVLSSLGGALGYVLGQWVTWAYVSRLDLGADLPLHLDPMFDMKVFLFSFATAVCTGIAVGLWPAWRASRADPRAALHDGGKGQSDGGRQRVRRLLAIVQISGALALLVVAGLFVRTLSSARQVNLGFDADHLITARLDPRQIGYDEDRTNDFYAELQRRVARWPEVASVAVAFTTPMSYLIGGGSIYLEGQPVPAGSQPPASFINHVGHDYFEVMGIPIVRGRPFAEEDEHEHSLTRRFAIVNETMAERYWPGQDPIGRRFRAFNPTDPVLEIVGVARDSKYVLIFEAPRPYVYLPVVRDMTLRTLHVRTHGDPAALAPRLEREIKDLAPDLPIADLRTMKQSLAGIFGFLIFRIGAIQASGMGALGLTLALVGVYGVVSFSASLRTREIGIRVALGAQPRDILRLILGQGLQLVITGVIVGLAISIAMGRALSRFLPLVDATDWVTFAAVSIQLAALTLAACYLPARRATRLQVMAALRHE